MLGATGLEFSDSCHRGHLVVSGPQKSRPEREAGHSEGNRPYLQLKSAIGDIGQRFERAFQADSTVGHQRGSFVDKKAGHVVTVVFGQLVAQKSRCPA